VNSINYVLGAGGLSPYDLEHIGISRDPSANMLKKVLYTLARRPSLDMLRNALKNAAEVKDLKTQLTRALNLDINSIKAEFHNVEHHRAHVASTFFVSPFLDAAILSVDGMVIL